MLEGPRRCVPQRVTGGGKTGEMCVQTVRGHLGWKSHRPERHRESGGPWLAVARDAGPCNSPSRSDNAQAKVDVCAVGIRCERVASRRVFATCAWLSKIRGRLGGRGWRLVVGVGLLQTKGPMM